MHLDTVMINNTILCVLRGDHQHLSKRDLAQIRYLNETEYDILGITIMN